MARKKSAARPTSSLRKHFPLLKSMAGLSAEENKKIIPHLDHRAISHLCTCVYNLMFNSGRHLSKKNRAKLKKVLGPQKDCLRRLCTTNNLATRRKLLVQSGSGIGAILGVVIPIIASLIAGGR